MFREMYARLGDAAAQDELRLQNRNKHHCSWLRRKADACDSLPDGIDNIEPGSVCPHNVYAKKPEVFERAAGVVDTIERLFRLVNSAEVGTLVPSELDSLAVTELLTTKGELDRQENDRREREYETARLEAQANQSG